MNTWSRLATLAAGSDLGDRRARVRRGGHFFSAGRRRGSRGAGALLAMLMLLILALPAGPAAGALLAPAAAATAVTAHAPGFAAAASAGEPIVWSIGNVAAPKRFVWMGDHMLGVDVSGTIHLVYGGDHLYHAWHDTTWHRETVDAAAGIGQHASLAIDQASNLHVSYYDERNGDLKYAHKTAGGWTISVVDSGGNVGRRAAIALDAGGRPRIAYLDTTNGTVKYAAWNGAAWQVQTVAPGGYSVALALDAAGQAHLVFSTPQLQYAYQDGAAWHIEDIDGATWDWQASLALNAGQPEVTYLAIDGSSISYAARGPGGWSSTLLAHDRDSSFNFASLAIVGGQPAVLFDHSSQVQYGRLAGGTWQISPIGDAGQFGSLALDASGGVHAAYCYTFPGSGDCTQLRHALLGAGGWQAENVDDGGYIADGSAIALDPAGRAHVVYSLGPEGPLIYASWTGVAWDKEVIDPRPYHRWYGTLVFDPAGVPHAAFYYFGGLNYATRVSPGVWNVQLVDPLGMEAYLAFDAGGAAHLAYYSLGFGTPLLGYAHQVAGGWDIKTVEMMASPGGIAVDQAGRPVIAYAACAWGTGPCGIRFATWNGTGWDKEVVVDTGAAPTSFALDALGHRHVGYFSDVTLHYAYFDGVNWSFQLVDGMTGSGAETSLALDAANRPHFSYPGGIWAGEQQGLRYAYLGAGGWISTTVDINGSNRFATGLALDAHGNPQISYIDETNGDLKYAFGLPLSQAPAVCAAGPAYWRQHSEYGPLPYDVAWNRLAQSAHTPFFAGGQSYYEVLQTPASGRPYYYLAHYYAAFQLNLLRGVPFTVPGRATFAQAGSLLAATTPAALLALPPEQRRAVESQMVDLALALRATMLAQRSTCAPGEAFEAPLDAFSLLLLPYIGR